LKVVGALGIWIALSGTLILFNAHVLSTFHHPITLTLWHHVVSVAMILFLRLVRPSLLTIASPGAGIPELTLGKAIRLGLPVAFCQGLGLITGNGAYMYLTVAFLQMMKAWTPTGVYLSGCLMGTQKWSIPIVKCLAIITCGLMVTSVGELKFNLLGFSLQLTSLLTEGVRINLLELRLKSQGYKLNPLTASQVFAPQVAALLLIPTVAFDMSAFDMPKIDSIGKGVFVLNALVAFCLNMAIYLAIQVASGLTFALAGIIKDLALIAAGCILQGTTVTPTQVVGYAIALCGLQAYGVVSKEPSSFEGGVLMPVLKHFFGGQQEKQPAEAGGTPSSRIGAVAPGDAHAPVGQEEADAPLTAPCPPSWAKESAGPDDVPEPPPQAPLQADSDADL